ncbi:hypothetical protein O5D80_008623 [Batrachochytrium dendrobatidis]|nr:hypothetical protein O5D80_008623 [Batrachochytrium dendrobatidis]
MTFGFMGVEVQLLRPKVMVARLRPPAPLRDPIRGDPQPAPTSNRRSATVPE